MTVDERSFGHENPLALVGRIVAVFLIVGAGIGGATLIFLSATGFFDATASEDLEAIGDLFLGGIALATILVVSLVVGIVLAALGGMYAASKSPDRGIAAAVGAIAGTLGHVALVAVLGLFLVVGIELFDSDESEASRTPVPTRSAEDIASCEQAFGVGSEVCRDDPADETTTGEGGVSFEDMWRIGLGLIPALAVGGLSGAIGFTRRFAPIADVPVIVESRRGRFEPSTARSEPPLRRAKSPARKAKPAQTKAKPTTRKPATRRRPARAGDLTEERSDYSTDEPSTDRPSEDFTIDLPELPEDEPRQT